MWREKKTRLGVSAKCGIRGAASASSQDGNAYD